MDMSMGMEPSQEELMEQVRAWQQQMTDRIAAVEAYLDQRDNGEFTRQKERRRVDLGPPDGMEERREAE